MGRSSSLAAFLAITKAKARAITTLQNLLEKTTNYTHKSHINPGKAYNQLNTNSHQHVRT
ncbi:conserved hypothetical protein [Ricinus communis]|uniref:Uncharacterized protein n=1 Tax=Ricinus communis TaxID=3988 RepID=B9SJB4_RICCO|nr:conserved hypothetical protein [Ricinus communis]